MTKMTKAELTDLLKDKLEEQCERLSKVESTSEWTEINNSTYEDCKEICKSNGVVDESFYMLWERAVDDVYHKMGIVPDLPRYRKA